MSVDINKKIFCRLLMKSLMHIQFITILQETFSPLGNVSVGFGEGGVVWYDFMSDLVTNIDG